MRLKLSSDVPSASLKKPASTACVAFMNTMASCTHDRPSNRSTAVAMLLLMVLLRMLARPTPSEMRRMAPVGLTLWLMLHLQSAWVDTVSPAVLLK